MWKPCILSFLNLPPIVKVTAMMKIMSMINDHNIEMVIAIKRMLTSMIVICKVWWFEEKEEDG